MSTSQQDFSMQNACPSLLTCPLLGGIKNLDVCHADTHALHICTDLHADLACMTFNAIQV